MFTIKHTMQPYESDRREFAIEAVSYEARTAEGYLHFVSVGADGRKSVWGGRVSDEAFDPKESYTGSIFVMNGQGSTVDTYRYVESLSKLDDEVEALEDAA